MYIIVGLGNPTRQYEGTKHNVGFDTIDYLIDEYQIPSSVQATRLCSEKA